MSSFRDAVEVGDLDAVEAMLADDVVFRSPVAHSPYPGRPLVGAILRAVFEVFTDFHYVREARGDDGFHVLFFEARVDRLDIAGCDVLTVDTDGRIAEFTVLVRPLRAAQALAQAMAARYPAIVEAAGRSQA